jgi:hypothetical protein
MIRQKHMCLVLAFLLVFNPILFEVSCWAATQDVTSSQKTAEETAANDKKVQETKEISLSWLQKLGLSIGGFLKGKDYKKTIKDANAKIKEAKVKSAESNKGVTGNSSTVKSANSTGRGAKSTLTATAQAKATLQKSLQEAGKALLDIGKTLGTVVTVLRMLGGSLSGTGVLSAVGVVVVFIAQVLQVVSLALGALGQALIASGQTGAERDKGYFNALTTAASAYTAASNIGSSFNSPSEPTTTASTPDLKTPETSIAPEGPFSPSSGPTNNPGLNDAASKIDLSEDGALTNKSGVFSGGFHDLPVSADEGLRDLPVPADN